MINLTVVILIIFIHWIADFVLQTDWEATNKSTNIKALLSHTLRYSVWWTVFIIIYGIFFHQLTILNALLFILITFIAHTITDYFTSRLNKKLWDTKQVHNFFVSIGFDQILHYVQLLLTFYFILK
jgi:hypothetical protein